MKKLLVVLMLLMAIPVFAADWAGTPVMDIAGRFGPTIKYTMTSDTAVSLETAYAAGTWLSTAVGPSYTSGVAPIGFIISVETNDGRISFGGGTPEVGAAGHVIASGSSMWIRGPGLASTVKITNSATGANAVFQITPEYQQ